MELGLVLYTPIRYISKAFKGLQRYIDSSSIYSQPEKCPECANALENLQLPPNASGIPFQEDEAEVHFVWSADTPASCEGAGTTHSSKFI
eukprot:UN03525